MELGAVVRVALRALARNKMRTALTMLGIIIGVGAVICTVAIGEGASNQVQEQIRNLGDNIVFVSAGSVNQHGVHIGSTATKTLKLSDARAIQQQVPVVSKVSPGVGSQAQVVYGNQNWFTLLRGVSPAYLEIRRWVIASGSAFSQREVDSSANVCLIGLTVEEEDDFKMRSPTDIANIQVLAWRIMWIILVVIGSVLLLVGGIEIMNIMLVLVTERTRENGVRMAVGAIEKDVRMQFMSEA